MGRITLVARRVIRANAERVFQAWTDPVQLRAWWGPRPVTCSEAEVDLRTGGRYRLVNALPDGSHIVIHGEFRVVEAPHKLVYTWRMVDGEKREGETRASGESSLVSVRFEPKGEHTEVVVVHEEIPSEAVKKTHEDGWNGCLDGLEAHFGS